VAGAVRLADLLAALSVATDLGTGHEPEKAIRACLVATELARGLGGTEPEVADVYHTTLLRHLGCSATAHEEAYLFGGDELVSRPVGERTDFGNPRELISMLAAVGRGTGPARARYVARAVANGKRADRTVLGAICEVGARLAERLGLGEGVREGIAQIFERWDGKGVPNRIGGEAIVLGARLAQVAHQAVLFDRLGGPELAVGMIRQRGGRWLDPRAAELFAREGPAILGRLAEVDVWDAVLETEPAPHRTVEPEGLDRLARTFADFVDLKAPFLLGHSSEVAELAAGAGRSLGLGEDEVRDLQRAACLHDLGRAAVSNGVWEKPGPLSAAEREQVRLHAYHTERILSRSSALAPLARTAATHHERLDGTGYHRGSTAAELSVAERILAAADAFQAMTRPRPHREALSPEAAARALGDEARSARLDPECVRAVVEAAGVRAPRVRGPRPAGLSEREVEVLRLLALGHSNRQIARRLSISPRTAEHHVQHVYAKTGLSSRAAAALFALEQGLLSR
jgi:HD-GYP domain-containing protein (c-di-GMP phosphodiesterase class II)